MTTLDRKSNNDDREHFYRELDGMHVIKNSNLDIAFEWKDKFHNLEDTANQLPKEGETLRQCYIKIKKMQFLGNMKTNIVIF